MKKYNDSTTGTNLLLEATLNQEFSMTKSGEQFADTNAHTPATGFRWCYIQVISATGATFTALEENGVATTGLTGISFPQGYPLYGNWTSLTLASGSVRCHYATNI